MNSDDVRANWWAYYHEMVARTVRLSMGPLEYLLPRYQQLSEAERTVVDVELAEAVDSDDSALRYDAAYLIRHFRISSAVPQLRAFSVQLSAIDGVPARNEKEKIDRLIGLLTADGQDIARRTRGRTVAVW